MNQTTFADVGGAVSDEFVMTMTNELVSISTRGPTPSASVQTPASWWGAVQPFGQRCLFDHESQRWLASASVGAPNANGGGGVLMMIAVSATANPTGAWTRQSFWTQPIGSTEQADYTMLGVSSRWVAVTADMYGPTFVGPQLWVFDKATLLAGTVAATNFPTGFSLDNGVYAGGAGNTVHPCVTYDTGVEDLYLVDVVEITGAAPAVGRISRISGAAGAPVWAPVTGSSVPGGSTGTGESGVFGLPSAFVDLFVDPGAATPPMGPPATTGLFQCSPNVLGLRVPVGSGVAGAPVYQNGSIWFTHMGGVPGSGRIATYWYELDPFLMPNPIVQSGVLDAGGVVHAIQPSIAVNCAGDALIGCTLTGTSLCPSAAYALRLGGDALGSLRPLNLYQGSNQAYGFFGNDNTPVWGRYSATSVDPLDLVAGSVVEARGLWTAQLRANQISPLSVPWRADWAFVAENCIGGALSDFEEIQATALDGDNDGNPDGCEADCQPNTVADHIELAANPSLDCDGNDVPDVCDAAAPRFRAALRSSMLDAVAALDDADFDDDGTRDLAVLVDREATTAVIARPSRLVIALNDGSGRFIDHDLDALPANGLAVVAAQLDPVLDPAGLPDVAVVGEDDLLRIYLNAGTIGGRWGGVISTGVAVPAITGFEARLDVGDFDADGDLDLLFATIGEVRTFRNDGSGGFTPWAWAIAGPPVPIGVTPADVDGDGDLDVLATRQTFTTPTPNPLIVIENDGFGVLTPIADYATGVVDPYVVHAADFDRDGDVDCVVSGASIGFMRNDGSGVFSVQAATGLGGMSPGGSLSVADVNGDGRRDLVSASSLGQLTTAFAQVASWAYDAQAATPSEASGDVRPLVVADFDGDARADVAWAATSRSFIDLFSNKSWLGYADQDTNGIPDGCEPTYQSGPICFGDGSGTACPCANAGATGHGCANSINTAGALLTAAGATSPDSIVLTSSGMPNAASTLFFQGTSVFSAGIQFGDGLRCAGGSVLRLGIVTASGGVASYPSGGALPVALKGLVPMGSTRYYQAWYRNPGPFCTSSTFNLSNGYRIVWF